VFLNHPLPLPKNGLNSVRGYVLARHSTAQTRRTRVSRVASDWQVGGIMMVAVGRRSTG